MLRVKIPASDSWWYGSSVHAGISVSPVAENDNLPSPLLVYKVVYRKKIQ